MSIVLKRVLSALLIVVALSCLAYFATYTAQNIAMKRNVLEFQKDVLLESNKDVNIIKESNGVKRLPDKKRIRLLCWIKTNPKNLNTKAKTIKQTWGPRCDITLYMSSVADRNFPAIGLNVSEGREYLTDKAMKAFHYVYKHHLDDADWFFAADDDTYMIAENMRHFLIDKDPSIPIYYGHHFHVIVKQGYSSGGSGYVLSREALRRLGKYGYDPKLKCEQKLGADDAEIGKCLEKLNVPIGDSRDEYGRSRFHCFNPGTHVNGGYPDWYLKYDAHGAKQNFLSDYAISFHYISPDGMRELDYLIYHLRPYGTIKDTALYILSKEEQKNTDQPDPFVQTAEEKSAVQMQVKKRLVTEPKSTPSLVVS